MSDAYDDYLKRMLESGYIRSLPNNWNKGVSPRAIVVLFKNIIERQSPVYYVGKPWGQDHGYYQFVCNGYTIQFYNDGDLPVWSNENDTICLIDYTASVTTPNGLIWNIEEDIKEYDPLRALTMEECMTFKTVLHAAPSIATLFSTETHNQTEELHERIRELTTYNNDLHESTVILRGHIRELIETRNRRQWVRVADRLPDQSGFYLGIHDDIQTSVVRYKRDLNRWEFALPLGSGIVLPVGFEHPMVTHWQPLPEFPE